MKPPRPGQPIAADTATVLGWFRETSPAKSRAPLPSEHAVDQFRYAVAMVAHDFWRLDPAAPEWPSAVSENTARAAAGLLRAIGCDIERAELLAASTKHPAASKNLVALRDIARNVERLESGRGRKFTWHRIAVRVSDALDGMLLVGFEMPKDRGADGWRCALVKRVLGYFGIPCGELEAVSDALRGKRGGQKKPIKKPLTARPDSIAKGHHHPATERQNDDR